MLISKIASFLGAQTRGDIKGEVSGIQYDSRKVDPGDLFVCLVGAKSDGHQYAAQAVAKGGTALLCERFLPEIQPEAAQIIVPDARLALARLSAFWFDFPCRKLRMIGVTGTNGKTTTTHLIKGLLEKKGETVGLIGTIHNLAGSEELPSTHTTPESLELAGLLDRMVRMNSQSAVMEVSSHALKQHRVAGCDFDVAVFTNLTQDHLDYHPTWEDYMMSKRKLFEGLQWGDKPGNKYGVINADDPAAPEFIAACRVPVLTYGIQEHGMYWAGDIKITGKGTSFDLHTPDEVIPLQMPLIGMFNVYNVLAAAAVALQEGVSASDLVSFFRTAPQVPGRFELVSQGQPFPVVVDYAHTPDGLENILKTARKITKGRLITVFGCGGDRDRGKRPIMGRISGEYSGFTLVTSDNPRTEEPESILAEIEAGISGVTNAYQVIGDRRQAIFAAITEAKAEDMVVIAGKGHETYQLIKGQTLHFDDREVAGEALKAAGYEI